MANVNLIPKERKISAEEMGDALIRELCTGRKFIDAKEKARERAAAQEAQAARNHRTLKGLGKLAVCIPQSDFLDLATKYGPEAFEDRGFVRDLQRLEPQFKVHNV